MNWICTSCGHHVTLGHSDIDFGEQKFCSSTGLKSREGFRIVHELRRCPNLECQQSDLVVYAFKAVATKHPSGSVGIGVDSGPAGIGKFRFLPTTPAPLSKHAPPNVVEDYSEAYLIRELSPKASATLARRALQGMIRDFWQVSKGRLIDELKAIKGECDPDLYDAMMAVKSVGNIGAHPERDVSLIVDIEPDEPQQLLDVIHLLDNEWYVARATRAARLAKMKELGAKKAAEQDGAKNS